MDQIVLPPQPVAGASDMLSQAKIARISQQGGVNDFETKVMFKRPVLHDFFHPFQTKNNLLIQFRILEVLNELNIITAFAVDISRNRRDEDRSCSLQDLG